MCSVAAKPAFKPAQKREQIQPPPTLNPVVAPDYLIMHEAYRNPAVSKQTLSVTRAIVRVASCCRLARGYCPPCFLRDSLAYENDFSQAVSKANMRNNRKAESRSSCKAGTPAFCFTGEAGFGDGFARVLGGLCMSPLHSPSPAQSKCFGLLIAESCVSGCAQVVEGRP